MTHLARETVRIVEELPRDKAKALVEYARYLAEKADEEEWQRRFRNRKYAPRLKAMAEQALVDHREGKTRPLNSRSI